MKLLERERVREREANRRETYKEQFRSETSTYVTGLRSRASNTQCMLTYNTKHVPQVWAFAFLACRLSSLVKFDTRKLMIINAYHGCNLPDYKHDHVVVVVVVVVVDDDDDD